MSLSNRLESGAQGVEAAPAAEAHGRRPAGTLTLRVALLASCLLAAAGVTFFASAAGGTPNIDPDLAKLVKAMAVIKSVILLSAGAAIWWRLASAVNPALAAGYIVLAAACTGGAALVWNMTGLTVAPFLFDGGLLGFLILALRDDNGPWLRSLTRARSRRTE
jgi:hypothetical protein